MAKIPSDEAAEQAVIGAMLAQRTAIEPALDTISATEFYGPLNAAFFSAIQDLYEHGEPIDTTTVASRVKDQGGYADVDLTSILWTYSIEVPSPTNVRHYAKAVEKAATARTVLRATQTALMDIGDGVDPYDVTETLTKTLLGIGKVGNEQEAKTMKELVRMDEAVSQVVIPGLLAVDHRAILVAAEGHGKSSILRAIAMKAAAGVHPFTNHYIPPVRTLIVDVENPLAAVVGTGRPLDEHLENISAHYEEGMCRIWRRPGGIDIVNSRRDRADFQREIALQQPSILCMGPLYKLYKPMRGSTYEDSAEAFVAVVDALRVKYGFAVLIEAHAAKGDKSGREMNVFGSSVFMRWPELGLGLYNNTIDPTDTTLTVKRFRGDRLQGMTWPTQIRRDPKWSIVGDYL